LSLFAHYWVFCFPLLIFSLERRVGRQLLVSFSLSFVQLPLSLSPPAVLSTLDFCLVPLLLIAHPRPYYYFFPFLFFLISRSHFGWRSEK